MWFVDIAACRYWYDRPACGADGQTIASENRVSAQRLAHQPPQAHRENCQKANDLAREAVGCMGVFGALVSRSE
jgi:hypothetical protein